MHSNDLLALILRGSAVDNGICIEPNYISDQSPSNIARYRVYGRIVIKNTRAGEKWTLFGRTQSNPTCHLKQRIYRFRFKRRRILQEGTSILRSTDLKIALSTFHTSFFLNFCTYKNPMHSIAIYSVQLGASA